ncbi:MAG: glycosyltransferase family 4 protein [Candidatus Heimdallarchaeaceae archaeon]
MKILFDLRNVGLGNNGGSLTLIKSGNTLQEMGHEVYFIDSGKNKHTWAKLETEHIVAQHNEEIPSADFIIATGYKSVAKTVSAPGRCGHKTHWIRGWETWQFPPKKIVAYILKAPTIKLVNSMGLKNKLKSFNFKSEIIRPGYDLKELFPNRKRNKKHNFTIGGLYTRGKHEQIKRTNWVFEAHRYLKKKYGKIDLWMFGNDNVSGGLVDNYFHRPTMDAKQYMYNNIDVWLSPAIQEGLHMPPAEAMMTGCPVVGVDAELSGTHDYLIDGVTGIVTENKLDSFINAVEKIYLEKSERIFLGKNARKKIEEIGDRQFNMQKLIDYFMGIIS